MFFKELAFRDTLQGKTGLSYDPLSEKQKSVIQAQMQRYIEEDDFEMPVREECLAIADSTFFLILYFSCIKIQ